ncbi:putative pectinesterase [Dioscorea sansibarensis]
MNRDIYSMESPLTTVILIGLILLSLALASESLQPQCDTSPSFTPSTAFTTNLQSTIEEVQKLISLLTPFSSTLRGGDLRLTSAISDCLDLLDLSSDQLSLSLAPSGGTGNRPYDVRSWLSAALGNQDTCHESLSGTNGIVGSLVSSGLNTVSSRIASSLREVSSISGSKKTGHRRLLQLETWSGFPEWVRAGDRRLLQTATPKPDAIVAQDGSGNFKTVKEAVEAAPTESEKRYVIYVKKGVYQENVEIKKKKWNLMIFGDGMGQTVISSNRNFVEGWTTFRTATFAVSGKGFIGRDITFENTAGPQQHQAVAFRSDSDLSVCYRCSMEGYQDTLYAHSLRQFYRECHVSGTVDFMFGNAAAVFQKCQIEARSALPDQKNSVTAQGRKDPNQNTGFTLQFCNVSTGANLTNQTPTYLGRPWKQYSRTVIMQTYLGSIIRPEGWLPWQGDFALDTLYYAEYMNRGPGAGLANRVKWPGYHALSDPAQVANFTVAQFIQGDMWLPSTGVTFTAGLME